MRLPVTSTRLPIRTTVLALVLAVVLAGAVAVTHPVRAEAIQDLRQVLRAALLSGAGLLLLGQWKTTGLARPAFLGLAFLLLGLLSDAVTAVSPLIYGGAEQPVSGPALALLPSLAAGILMLWASRTASVDTSARPARLLGTAFLVAAFAGAAILLLTVSATRGDEEGLAAAGSAWRGALWMTVALAFLRKRRETPWLLPVLVLASLAAFLDATSALVGEPFGAAAAVLVVGAATWAVRFAAVDFASAVAAQSARLLHLTADVTEHERRSRSASESQAVRLHEVRNVLAGLHGATATLRRYEDKLGPGVRHRLEDAISAELSRLQHLVDPPKSRPSEPVQVKDALQPLLVAERELGSLIRADLHRVTAIGCAADIVTIVSGLLVNARVHAPGAPVLVRSRVAGLTVQVVVEDGGPGIPAHLHEVVFERGERGAATAPGSGLGLYNARELAEQMGGTLTLGPRPLGGTSFVLTLPAASPQVRERVPQQRQRREAARS